MSEEIEEINLGAEAPLNTDAHSEMPQFKKFSTSEKRELRVWYHIKKIPVLNTAYGTIRSIVYSCKGNKEEAIRSAVNAVGGIAGFGISTVVITCITGPVVIPVVCAVLVGGAAQQLVAGGGEFAIDVFADAELKNAIENGDRDKIESRVYERITGDMPVIGAAYSALRGIVYLGKGNKKEAKRSGKNFGINLIASGTAIGAGCGIASVAELLSSTSDAVTNNIPYISQAAAVATTRTAFGVQQPLNKMVNRSPLHLGDVDGVSFHNCVVNFQQLTSGLHSMEKRRQVLAHIVKCMIAGAEFGEFEFSGGDDKGANDAIRKALQNGDPALLQAFITFWSSHDRLYERLTTIFNEDNPCSWSLSEYVVKITHRRSYEVHADTPFLFPTSFVCAAVIPKLYQYIPTELPYHRPTPEQLKNVPAEPLRILTLCGGGTRGLISLELLATIEKKTGRLIKDSFDYIGGTSTGGLLALYLAHGHTVAECRRMYFELKDKVFSSPPPHNEKQFEQILKTYFPETVKMSDIKGIRVCIVAQTGTVEHLRTHVFQNTEDNEDPIWMIARATSAAPGFFKPMVINGSTFIDGGLGANNPTNTVLTELTNNDEVKLKNATVVSIGTGQYHGAEKDINRMHITGTPFGVVSGLVSGDIANVVGIMVNRITESDGDEIKKASALCKSSKAFFYHLNPTLPEDLKLNETDDEKLINGMWHGKIYANVHDSIFHEISQRLLHNHSEVSEA